MGSFAVPFARYYFYGQAANGPPSIFLVELLLRADTGTLSVTVKSADAARLPAFLETWNACLVGFLVVSG